MPWSGLVWGETRLEQIDRGKRHSREYVILRLVKVIKAIIGKGEK